MWDTPLNSRLELLNHFLMNFVLYTDGLLTGNLLPGVQCKSASNSLASVGGLRKKMHTGLFADTNTILSPSCVHEHGVASYMDAEQLEIQTE